MTGIPDAVVELTDEERAELATWAREGIYHCPCRMRCMCDDEDKVYLFDAVGSIIAARFAAASGPWAEQLDAANEGITTITRRLCEVADERDAALARNAELQRELGQWKDRMWVSVRERAVWSHEAGEHAGDIPFMHCPMCESKTLRAELDNLRETLAQKIETTVLPIDHTKTVTVVDVQRHCAAIVRGSDDE